MTRAQLCTAHHVHETLYPPLFQSRAREQDHDQRLWAVQDGGERCHGHGLRNARYNKDDFKCRRCR